MADNDDPKSARPNKNDDTQNITAQENEEGGTLRDLIARLGALTHEIKANRESDTAEREKDRKRQNIFNTLTLIVSVLTLVVLALTYTVYRNISSIEAAQTTILDKQRDITDKLVVEQGKASRAAQQSADAATSAARTATEALTLSINTDVEADGVICTDIQDLGPTFWLKASNKGSRRATEVQVTWGYQIGGTLVTVQDFCKHFENLVAPILEAGASIQPVQTTGLWGCMKDPESADMKTGVIHEIEHGGRALNIVGHIDFIDVLGNPQTRPFEYSYQPDYSTASDKRAWTCNFIPQFQKANGEH